MMQILMTKTVTKLWGKHSILKKLYNDKNCEHQFLVKVIKEAKPNDKNGGPKHGKDIKEEQTGY